MHPLYDKRSNTMSCSSKSQMRDAAVQLLTLFNAAHYRNNALAIAYACYARCSTPRSFDCTQCWVIRPIIFPPPQPFRHPLFIIGRHTCSAPHSTQISNAARAATLRKIAGKHSTGHCVGSCFGGEGGPWRDWGTATYSQSMIAWNELVVVFAFRFIVTSQR